MIGQKFSFMTKPPLPNQKAVVSMILSINISNSNNQQVLSWHLHTPGSHQSSLLNGSQLVSQSVTDKGKQWSDSGPIKRYSLLKIWKTSRKDILSRFNEIETYFFSVCKAWKHSYWFTIWDLRGVCPAVQAWCHRERVQAGLVKPAELPPPYEAPPSYKVALAMSRETPPPDYLLREAVIV